MSFTSPHHSQPSVTPSRGVAHIKCLMVSCSMASYSEACLPQYCTSVFRITIPSIFHRMEVVCFLFVKDKNKKQSCSYKCRDCTQNEGWYVGMEMISHKTYKRTFNEQGLYFCLPENSFFSTMENFW